jgi:hypothetical protein
LGYFYNLKKLTKISNRPPGENSPNLVTLFQIGAAPEAHQFPLKLKV